MSCGGRWGRCSSGSKCSTSIGGPASRRGTAAWLGTARSAIPSGRCASGTWMRCWRGGWWRWRVSLAYDGERADAQGLEQLETILRVEADELAEGRERAGYAEDK